jgi:hypothetical protein
MVTLRHVWSLCGILLHTLLRLFFAGRNNLRFSRVTHCHPCSRFITHCCAWSRLIMNGISCQYLPYLILLVLLHTFFSFLQRVALSHARTTHPAHYYLVLARSYFVSRFTLSNIVTLGHVLSRVVMDCRCWPISVFDTLCLARFA